MASSPFNVVKNNLEGAVYRGDLNNVTTGGIYSITGSDVTHHPAELAEGSTGNLMVIHCPIVTHQLLFIGSTTIYMRRLFYGSWSAWAKTTLTPET